MQPLLLERDMFVSRCMVIESHPDDVGRKIPSALDARKAGIQIGE